jgi:hydrogenase-4 component F
MAVAVPFLSRPLVWKRLLAYSSLEHMGVIALGLGFATPLAVAGVTVHIVAHAIAKTLGFAAVTPLLAHDPGADTHQVTGVARTQPLLAAGIGLALATLSGLPPLPLFASELLIVAGGFQSGRGWVAATATVLLALAFLGLMRALLDMTVGEASELDTARRQGLRGLAVLTAVSALALAALTAAAVWLPASQLVRALITGLSS